MAKRGRVGSERPRRPPPEALHYEPRQLRCYKLRSKLSVHPGAKQRYLSSNFPALVPLFAWRHELRFVTIPAVTSADPPQSPSRSTLRIRRDQVGAMARRSREPHRPISLGMFISASKVVVGMLPTTSAIFSRNAAQRGRPTACRHRVSCRYATDNGCDHHRRCPLDWAGEPSARPPRSPWET